MVQTRFRLRQETLGKRKGKEEEKEKGPKEKKKQKETAEKPKNRPLKKPTGQNLVLHNMVEDGILPPGTPLAFLTESGTWWTGHISLYAPYVIQDDKDPSISGYRFPGPWVNAVIQRTEERKREIDKLQTLSELSRAVQEELDFEELEEIGCNSEEVSSIVYATLETLDGLGKINRTHRERIPARDGTWDQIRAYVPVPNAYSAEMLAGQGRCPSRENPETWQTLSDFKQVYSAKRAKVDWRKRVVERIHYTLDRIVSGEVPAELVEYETGMNRFLSSALDFGLWITQQSEELNHFVKSQSHPPEQSCQVCKDGKPHMDGTQFLCSKMLDLISTTTATTAATQKVSEGDTSGASQQQSLFPAGVVADYELEFRQRLDDSHPLFCFFAQTALLRFLKDDLLDITLKNRVLAKHQARIHNLSNYVDQLENGKGLVKRKKRSQKKITPPVTPLPYDATDSVIAAPSPPTQPTLLPSPSPHTSPLTPEEETPPQHQRQSFLRQSCPAVLSVPLEGIVPPLQTNSRDPNVFSTYASTEGMVPTTTTTTTSIGSNSVAQDLSVAGVVDEGNYGDVAFSHPALFTQDDYYPSVFHFETASDTTTGLIPFMCTESPVSRSLSPVCQEMQVDPEKLEPFFLPEDTLACLNMVEMEEEPRASESLETPPTSSDPEPTSQPETEPEAKPETPNQVEDKKSFFLSIPESGKKGWWLGKGTRGLLDILSFTIPAKVKQCV